MDTTGEQHLQIEHNIFKRRLDLNGKPIEDPQRTGTKYHKSFKIFKLNNINLIPFSSFYYRHY